MARRLHCNVKCLFAGIAADFTCSTNSPIMIFTGMAIINAKNTVAFHRC